MQALLRRSFVRPLSTPLPHGLCRIPDVLVHAIVSEGEGCHGAGEERLQMVAHLHCEVVRPVTCAARHGSCHVGEALRRRGLARRTVETRAALAGTAALEKQPTTCQTFFPKNLFLRASADCPLPGQDGASSNVAQQLCR